MGLWKDPRTGLWRYSFWFQGQRYRAGKYRSKADARTAREDHRKLVIHLAEAPATAAVKETPTTFLEIATAYLKLSERRHAKLTFEYKRYVYKSFLDHAGGDIPLDKITPFLVQSYLETRHSNSNYNRHRKDLSALFEYARKVMGVIPLNPCAVLDKLPEEKAEKEIPTEDEFLRLISAATDVERQLILVLAYTAARIGEVLRLQWKDVDFSRNFVRLWTKKTKDGTYRSREIPMKPYFRAIMFRMWEVRTQETWVFFNRKTGERFNRRPKFMHGVCKRAGIKPYGFHAIRHFVSAILLDRNKIGTPTVSKFLGHTNLSTTDIYAHSIGIKHQDDALDVAVERLEDSIPKLLPAPGGQIEPN
jgi:integrase